MRLAEKVSGGIVVGLVVGLGVVYHDLELLKGYADDFLALADAQEGYGLVFEGVEAHPNIYEEKALILADLEVQKTLKDCRESWEGLDDMLFFSNPWDSEPHYKVYTGL